MLVQTRGLACEAEVSVTGRSVADGVVREAGKRRDTGWLWQTVEADQILVLGLCRDIQFRAVTNVKRFARYVWSTSCEAVHDSKTEQGVATSTSTMVLKNERTDAIETICSCTEHSLTAWKLMGR